MVVEQALPFALALLQRRFERALRLERRLECAFVRRPLRAVRVDRAREFGPSAGQRSLQRSLRAHRLLQLRFVPCGCLRERLGDPAGLRLNLPARGIPGGAFLRVRVDRLCQRALAVLEGGLELPGAGGGLDLLADPPIGGLAERAMRLVQRGVKLRAGLFERLEPAGPGVQLAARDVPAVAGGLQFVHELLPVRVALAEGGFEAGVRVERLPHRGGGLDLLTDPPIGGLAERAMRLVQRGLKLRAGLFERLEPAGLGVQLGARDVPAVAGGLQFVHELLPVRVALAEGGFEAGVRVERLPHRGTMRLGGTGGLCLTLVSRCLPRGALRLERVGRLLQFDVALLESELEILRAECPFGALLRLPLRRLAQRVLGLRQADLDSPAGVFQPLDPGDLTLQPGARDAPGPAGGLVLVHEPLACRVALAERRFEPGVRVERLPHGRAMRFGERGELGARRAQRHVALLALVGPGGPLRGVRVQRLPVLGPGQVERRLELLASRLPRRALGGLGGERLRRVRLQRRKCRLERRALVDRRVQLVQPRPHVRRVRVNLLPQVRARVVQRVLELQPRSGLRGRGFHLALELAARRLPCRPLGRVPLDCLTQLRLGAAQLVEHVGELKCLQRLLRVLLGRAERHLEDLRLGRPCCAVPLAQLVFESGCRDFHLPQPIRETLAGLGGRELLGAAHAPDLRVGERELELAQAAERFPGRRAGRAVDGRGRRRHTVGFLLLLRAVGLPDRW